MSELLALNSGTGCLPNTHEGGLDSLSRFDIQVGEKEGTVKYLGLVLDNDFFPPLLKFTVLAHP